MAGAHVLPPAAGGGAGGAVARTKKGKVLYDSTEVCRWTSPCNVYTWQQRAPARWSSARRARSSAPPACWSPACTLLPQPPRLPLPLPCAPAPLAAQARVRAIAEIVGALVAGVRRGEDVDLNAVKRAAQIKYSVDKGPKLVEIIAALPEEHKAVLLPQ